MFSYRKEKTRLLFSSSSSSSEALDLDPRSGNLSNIVSNLDLPIALCKVHGHVFLYFLFIKFFPSLFMTFLSCLSHSIII